MSEKFKARCLALAGGESDSSHADSFVGLFQRLRPRGDGIEQVFAELQNGAQYHSRLMRLYAAAGNDRRPDGNRDAYFIVRSAPEIDAQAVEDWGQQWLRGLVQMATRLDHGKLLQQLSPLPQIRVLEGIAPKQLKRDEDSIPLLKTLKTDAATMTDGIAVDCPVVMLLRQAYYYTACDWMLRDYLLWPSYENWFGEDDPLATYFELWRHGIKFRVFRDDTIDLYISR